ncbi:tRNA-His guanylyltransferase [Stygiomarasmius scandens]|uniref:tRNA(His) guanylyltransferase n=1 Tax=Marasmiellus scandens TaxID=2682957 RepID=A0ABR1JM12_9AGAR
MSGSKYEYVKKYELPDPLMLGTYMVFRLDGHSFHRYVSDMIDWDLHDTTVCFRFSDEHEFIKPNDLRALELMDRAAKALMEEYPDIVLAFGESDEYSFLLRKSTSLYNRRQAKIVSTLTSLFTSNYVFHWPKYFPEKPLQYPPSFDGRIVLYPTVKEVKDYFAWRQADTHINNLYNTTFWALVQQGGQTTTEAHATLRETVSKDKNEILFSRFGINYNEIIPRYRKGSVFVRTEIEDNVVVNSDNQNQPAKEHTEEKVEVDSDNQGEPKEHIEDEQKSARELVLKKRLERKEKKKKTKNPPTKLELLHCDVIKDEFWAKYPQILEE